MKKEIILIGAGGHCKSVIDVIEDAGEFIIKGIIDIPDKIGGEIYGYPIIGSDDQLSEFYDKYKFFHIAVGHIHNNSARVRLYKLLKSLNLELPPIIAKDAYVSKYSIIEEGCFVGHRAFVNAGGVIKKNTIINTGALIEHDSEIGEHCHISTMSTVNADCKIGDHCFLSSHAVINRGTTLGPNITVFSGAVVSKSFFQPGLRIKGVPAIPCK